MHILFRMLFSFCVTVIEILGTVPPPPHGSTWLSKPGTVGVAVEAALRVGYRHVDCAHRYANQDEIGAAIKTCLEEGVVKRDDLFVASKLW
jgi:diketogulonate reductase-like aldo/keto reductase